MDSDELPFSKENYKSALDHVEEVEEMFREDLKEGLMRWMSDEEAFKEFGKINTAAIGALEIGDSSFRVIHDATHGVQVNHEILVRDQVSYPTVAEKIFVINRAAHRGCSMMGLKADVAKAHRRCRIHQEDQRWLTCRTRPGGVWVNTVGTFGVGSA
eukprot:4981037-Karenia_brevis.AAC.1